MKSLMLSLGAVLLFRVVSVAALKDSTYTGEIMDSLCAKMGSHGMMLKEHGMAGKENDL